MSAAREPHWLYDLPEPDRTAKVLAAAMFVRWGSESMQTVANTLIPVQLRWGANIEGLVYAYSGQGLLDGLPQAKAIAAARSKAAEAIDTIGGATPPLRAYLEEVAHKAEGSVWANLVCRSSIEAIRTTAGAS